MQVIILLLLFLDREIIYLLIPTIAQELTTIKEFTYRLVQVQIDVSAFSVVKYSLNPRISATWKRI